MLTDRFPPEVRSSAHLFHDLARRFQARGHDVRVITKVPSKYTPPEDTTARNGWDVAEGVPVRRVRWVPFLNGSRAVRALDHLTLWMTFAAASRQWPVADIVLIYSPPLPLALAGELYRSWYGTPFVLNVQDLYPQTVVDLGLLRNPAAIWAAEKLEAAAYRLAERLVVHSPGNRDFLLQRKGLPADKVRVIYNWVDVDAVRPGLKENGFRQEHGLRRKFVVSFAGLMGYAQDLTTAIEAAALLEGRPDVVFLLVGEGVGEARWKAMVAERGLRNVRFLPLQPKDAYGRLLAASDVCLVPLARDLRTPVVPGKLQSIMASGRPVMATLDPAGDASQIIDAAQCGYTLEPGKVREFRDAVLRLHRDPALAERLGANGRAYAEQHFSLAACAEAYEQLFEEILAEKRAGAAERRSNRTAARAPREVASPVMRSVAAGGESHPSSGLEPSKPTSRRREIDG